jgi:hypothetical protein
MDEPTMQVLCKNCGATFTAFLQQMADKNAVVTCPCCGKNSRSAAENSAIAPGSQN